MLLTTACLYRNKTTNNKVRLIGFAGDLIQVQYTPSGTRAWFRIKDFTKIFTIE